VLSSQVRKELVEFCQALIRTPSLPGEEGALARLIADRMTGLGYDEVWRDEIGNVIGLIRGHARHPAVMFTAHMDHVDAGDPALWPHPPYSGVVEEGYVWGRGASDTKGAIATQVLLPLVLKERPAADVYVAEVVLEEKGGAGTRHLVNHLRPDVVIIGEATKNQLCVGHRGRVEVVATAVGKAAHASQPHLGKNPHYPLAEFLLRLQELLMSERPPFKATVAPTLYFTDQQSANVIPGKAWVHLDWRTVPGETPEVVLKRLREVGPGVRFSIPVEELTSYTGMRTQMKKVRAPYLLNAQHPVVSKIREVLERALGRKVDVGYWHFVTDAGYFAEQGIPVIGYSPCEEELAHTYQDRVSISLMEEALASYPALVKAIQG